MNKMFEYAKSKDTVIFSGIGYVCELFSAPIQLTGNIETGTLNISDYEELFRYSAALDGTEELYLPYSKSVTVDINGNTESISENDFIDWQLFTFSAETIYYLMNKCDGFPDVDEFFDPDEEYEKDNDYDPDSWLNENDIESKNEGVELVDRMRKENPDKFVASLRNSILDEYVGLLTNLETDIDDESFKEDIGKYSNWDVMLMTVGRGKFFPYFEDDSPNLLMDDYNLKGLSIRNYDEGEI
jgi:hypothetical protein